MLLSAAPVRPPGAAGAAAAGSSKGNHVAVEVLEDVSSWVVQRGKGGGCSQTKSCAAVPSAVPSGSGSGWCSAK
jgi:hypothetical protein